MSKEIYRRKKRHGMCFTKIYLVWSGMKTRCLNKNNPDYKNYGDRGITICEEWLGKNGFLNFYADMGNKPKNKSLDRIKNNLGYYKENCKWSTKREQANNRRTNHLLTFNGKTQNIKQWAKELEINNTTIQSRINRYGWSIEKALTK